MNVSETIEPKTGTIDYQKAYTELQKRNRDMRKTLCKMGQIHQNNAAFLTLTIQKAINHLESNDAGPALSTLKLAMDKIDNAGR